MNPRNLLLAVALFAAPVYVAAQPAQPAKASGEVIHVTATPPAAAPAAASPTVEHKATGTVEHLQPEASTEEVLGAAFKTIEEANKYFKDRETGTKKAFAWAAMLAAILNLLIALIRRTSPFWKKTRGKWVIRLLTLTIGVAAGVLGNIALGMPWWDAMILFISGPGSVLLQEYKKMLPWIAGEKTETKSEEASKNG